MERDSEVYGRYGTGIFVAKFVDLVTREKSATQVFTD
jgi:hypothetical protein